MSTDGGPSDLEAAIESYLMSKGKGAGGESGTYRRNAERELLAFVQFLEDQGIDSLKAIDATTLRQYVRDRLRRRDLRPATVHKYYDYVSAWIGWAQREGLVREHYGLQQTAREPLPDTDARTQNRQQTWHRDQRSQFLAYVDEQAHTAIDD